MHSCSRGGQNNPYHLKTLSSNEFLVWNYAGRPNKLWYIKCLGVQKIFAPLVCFNPFWSNCIHFNRVLTSTPKYKLSQNLFTIYKSAKRDAFSYHLTPLSGTHIVCLPFNTHCLKISNCVWKFNFQKIRKKKFEIWFSCKKSSTISNFCWYYKKNPRFLARKFKFSR